MIKSILLSGIALVAMSMFSGCQKEMVDEGPNTPNTRPLTAQEEKTVASSNDFAFRSFAKLSEAEGAENVFISPLSISMSLGMAYNGADGDTKEAMRQTLGFTLPTDDEINKSFKYLDALLKGIDKKVVFTSVNSLWHSKEYQLQAPFIKTNQTYFDATVQGLDFASPTAKDQMNNWVKSKTNGKIETIVDEVRRDHILFLINAIYFKGTWTFPFDKKLTKLGPFQLENGSTVTPDFMAMKNGEYLHYQDEQLELIDLPYGNQQYSMTILVPGRDRTVQEVAQELNAARLATLLANAKKTTYELYMPKFKLEYSKELNDMLKQLGMGIAFTGQANFSRMVEGHGNLAISEVKHKTFVEVNEEGTEAAAATSTGVMLTSLPPSVRIARPFVFLIREKSSGAILFIGKLMQPE
ncbi:serpin family protein [Pontibacter sp. BT731]|uniref:serpin family protein n=1 Tax=Pontibacter coccineus TaxID=3063328 RepID=UPI0026E330D9|nr:serpin family protein [Pontibacter sp. BT731]MDO6392472.1 serpin family protein [Pontibacter sp. BT731]